MSDFLFLKFEGKRFDGHMLPVELLSDFQVYKETLLSLAEMLYKQKNNGGRLPKGFKARFQLRLNVLEDGSTIAPLCREYDESYVEEDAQNDEFEEARDVLNKVIQNFSTASPQTLPYPEILGPFFDKFGSHLAADDKVKIAKKNEFDTPGAVIINFDSLVRRSVLLSLKKPYKAFFDIRGKIDSIVLSKERFSVILEASKSELSGKYPLAFEDALRDAHRLNEKYHVRIMGIGLYSADGILSSLDKIQHMRLFDEEGKVISKPDSEKRLDDIQSLEKGWYDGHGDKFDNSKVNLVRSIILELSKEIPAPFIYPSASNEIILEWSIGSWELSAEFVFDENNVLISAINVQTNEEKNKDYSLTDRSISAEIIDMFHHLVTQATGVKIGS